MQWGQKFETSLKILGSFFCINISNQAGNMIYTKFAIHTAWIKANKK